MLRHFSSLSAHGHTDVCVLERRSVVDAVASDCHEMAGSCQRQDNGQLLVRTDAGVDARTAGQLVESVRPLALGLAHLLARHDLVRGKAQPRLRANCAGCQRIVASHHRHVDAGAVAASDSLGDLWTNRILHACHSQKGQIDQVPVSIGPVRLRINRAFSERQHA